MSSLLVRSSASCFKTRGFRHRPWSNRSLTGSAVNYHRNLPSARYFLSYVYMYDRFCSFSLTRGYEPNCNDIRDSIHRSYANPNGLRLVYRWHSRFSINRVFSNRAWMVSFSSGSLSKLLANGHSWLFHGVPSYRVIADRLTTTSNGTSVHRSKISFSRHRLVAKRFHLPPEQCRATAIRLSRSKSSRKSKCQGNWISDSAGGNRRFRR